VDHQPLVEGGRVDVGEHAAHGPGDLCRPVVGAIDDEVGQGYGHAEHLGGGLADHGPDQLLGHGGLADPGRAGEQQCLTRHPCRGFGRAPQRLGLLGGLSEEGRAGHQPASGGRLRCGGPHLAVVCEPTARQQEGPHAVLGGAAVHVDELAALEVAEVGPATQFLFSAAVGAVRLAETVVPAGAVAGGGLGQALGDGGLDARVR
jgi:hypothetical protein